MPIPLPPLTRAAPLGLRFNDLMTEMAYALIEDVVNAFTTDAVAAPGPATVGMTSMIGVYSGAQVIVLDGDFTELITIDAITDTTITADFFYAHGDAVQIVGATFAAGELDAPLYTQAEILGYLIDVQNDYLLKVRPVYEEQTDFVIPQGARIIPQPDNAIRVERLVINQYSLRLVSQTDLDLENPNWMNETGLPRRFFEDELGTGNMGTHPIADVRFLSTIWYSKRALEAYTILDRLLVPRAFCHFIKYGALAKCWTKDGEQRSPQRAAYATKRYELGVMLGQRFMNGMGVPQPQGRHDAKFNPLVVG